MNLPRGNFGDVMIVGGGISGIQAALDLGTAGFKVYFVEKSPTVGGKMAHLDKTFPTNDCSMCIESPKFVECKRHPNIEMLTYSEVEKVEGDAGDFTVTVVRKPRYVDETKCTGCTVCVEYCPVTYPDQFNQGISNNKAIHIYFAQAIPLVTYIDESCLYLKEGKCRICEAACKTHAINFDQKPEMVEIKVGAIILSPGIEPFDARVREEYHYGDFVNVVNALDYERLLCATGPYEGEILRASDKKHPHNIAWIHCVGSRQVTEGGNSYCSAVCCTYTQKQVILTKDHDDTARCTIFHNDIRSYGKDFERFYQRTENLQGVRFIRSYVSIEREDPVTKNVTVRYSTPDNGVKEGSSTWWCSPSASLHLKLQGHRGHLRHRAQLPWVLQNKSCQSTPDHPPGDICQRGLPRAHGHTGIGPERERGGVPLRGDPLLQAGQPLKGEDLSRGEGRFR
jgi:heterodisulfide reductase subunit A